MELVDAHYDDPSEHSPKAYNWLDGQTDGLLREDGADLRNTTIMHRDTLTTSDPAFPPPLEKIKASFRHAPAGSAGIIASSVENTHTRTQHHLREDKVQIFNSLLL